MIMLKSIVLGLAIAFSLAYFVLALVARSRIRESIVSDADRLLTITMLWPFYDDLYEDSARPLRIAGMLVLVCCAALYAYWAMM
jgi:hypothetical protein